MRLRLIRPTNRSDPVGRISGTRHPALSPWHPLPDGGCALSGLQNRSDPVGRISGTRHPAMGFACGFGGRVPFTRRWGVSLIFYAVNGTREAAALPLSIPAAPRGNRCCALRSPPACPTTAGSTRHPVSVRLCPPSMASRPCHSRFGSPISAGTQPLAVRPEIKAMKVLLWARFCRPDKRKRHPAIRAAMIMPDGGSALSGLRERSY